MLPRSSLSGGECTTAADKSVTYPKLNSKRPWYGVIVVAREPGKPDSVKKFHFVLDMSAEQAKAEEQRQAKAAKEEQAKAAEKPAEKDADKTGKAGEKDVKTPAANRPRPLPYDRLIIDLNGGLDLTQAPVLDLMKSARSRPCQEHGRICIRSGYIVLGRRRRRASLPLRLLLKFNPAGDKMTFLPMLLPREGEVKLGQQVYTATLVQPIRMASLSPAPPAASSPPATVGGKEPSKPSQPAPRTKMVNVVGGFDQPTTPLFLTTTGHILGPPSYFFPDQLKTIHEADGEYYEFLANPTGDQLTVRPYPGERGVFAVGKGSRDAKEPVLTACGLFVRPTSDIMKPGTVIPAGDMFPLGKLLPPFPTAREVQDDRPKVAKYRLPEGEYQPLLLNLYAGPLEIRLSKDNAASQVKKEPGMVSIRKDKPFVLDFSAKPEVLVIYRLRRKRSSRATMSSSRRCCAPIPSTGCSSWVWKTSPRLSENTRCLSGTARCNPPKFASLDPDRGYRRCRRQATSQGQNALWLTWHLRVLVASTTEPGDFRRPSRADSDRHLRHRRPVRQGRKENRGRCEAGRKAR